MKSDFKILRLLIFLGAIVSLNQGFTQITDDFADGNFTEDPIWIGQTDRFVINASNELQLNAPAVAEESYLAVEVDQLENQSWEFLVRLGFATSSTSLTRVYLLSNSQDLLGSLNGYYVLIGDTPDEVSLYKQEGTTSTQLINGVDGSIASSIINVRVRVTRDINGNWELLRDVGGGSTFISEGSATDNVYQFRGYFGFRCKYTSSRSTQFFFDDIVISGTPVLDTSGPTIVSVSAISATSVDVKFNESVDQITAQNIGNYALNNGVTVSAAVLDVSDPSLVHITTSPLTNGQANTLTVNNVEDVNGNPILANSTIDFTYLVLGIAGYRDVVINEFLSDPVDNSQLPNADFVELFNNTDEYFNLSGWRLFDAVKDSSPLPSYVLAPDSYLIICDEEFISEFGEFGAVLGLPSFPEYNNTNDRISLFDQSNVLVDQVVYGSVADEGISNEQVNPSLVCSGTFNFRPSISELGGTPGAQNSVFMIVPDNFGPNVIRARAMSTDSIRIDFSEAINGALISSAGFVISPSIAISARHYLPAYGSSVFVKLASALTINTSYSVTVTGISDCSGNSISENSGTFVLGENPAQGDVLLSEVLFNPRTNGVDFVEIFNPSTEKNFELRGWKLATIDKGIVSSPKQLGAEGQVIKPREFLVFTTKPTVLATEYPKGNSAQYVGLASLPSFNDDADTVLLLNENDEIIEQFDYNEDFHYDLLEDEEGVSLERISYEKEVNDPNNWRSAASTVGFATPGRPNSQSKEFAAKLGKLTIDPKVFLPGNTGTGRDFTTINYQLNSGGQFANIMIYDQQGRPVKQLANGASLATEGFFRWDGTTDRGGMARMGYYLIVFELYSGTGKTQTLKETVVVGRDF